MDIKDNFAHLTERVLSNTREHYDRVKVSVALRVDDVYLVDRMAKTLDMTRQDVISEILHDGLPDAVRGYFQIVGDDPLEYMTWDEFQEKVEQGDFFK